MKPVKEPDLRDVYESSALSPEQRAELLNSYKQRDFKKVHELLDRNRGHYEQLRYLKGVLALACEEGNFDLYINAVRARGNPREHFELSRFKSLDPFYASLFPTRENLAGKTFGTLVDALVDLSVATRTDQPTLSGQHSERPEIAKVFGCIAILDNLAVHGVKIPFHSYCPEKSERLGRAVLYGTHDPVLQPHRSYDYFSQDRWAQFASLCGWTEQYEFSPPLPPTRPDSPILKQRPKPEPF
jgi:hypothetical protein